MGSYNRSSTRKKSAIKPMMNLIQEMNEQEHHTAGSEVLTLNAFALNELLGQNNRLFGLNRRLYAN